MMCLLRGWRDGDGAYRRAGRASQLEWQTNEGKFIALIARQFLQEEIFYDIDTVTHEQNKMAGQREIEIGINKAYLIPPTARTPRSASQEEALPLAPPASR
jgi:hypothetical protein